MAENKYKDTVTAKTIKNLLEEGLKRILVRDAAGRIEEMYEAHKTAQINDACLYTILKYEDGAGGTSRKVIAEEEYVVAWPGYEILGAGYGNDISLIP